MADFDIRRVENSSEVEIEALTERARVRVKEGQTLRFKNIADAIPYVMAAEGEGFTFSGREALTSGPSITPFYFPTPAAQRKTRLEEKIERLIQRFGSYVQYFDKKSPFNKPAQLNSHLKTIRRRRELGSVGLAATDSVFCESLHATLHNWGRGGRFPGLRPYGAFFKSIAAKGPELAGLDKYVIDDPALDVPKVAAEVWSLIESLEIVTNESKIVSGTKAMHHLLPDLVVPMDHGYTQPFFERQNPDFQYRGESVFHEIFVQCARIARSVPVGSYVDIEKKDKTWRTSRTKVIDNAIVAYCISPDAT